MRLCWPYTEVSGIDGIRVLGQTEDSIQVDWQNPAAPLDHFRLTHANPDGQEEEQIVPMSAEARTTNTIVGTSFKQGEHCLEYC